MKVPYAGPTVCKSTTSLGRFIWTPFCFLNVQIAVVAKSVAFHMHYVQESLSSKLLLILADLLTNCHARMKL